MRVVFINHITPEECGEGMKNLMQQIQQKVEDIESNQDTEKALELIDNMTGIGLLKVPSYYKNIKYVFELKHEIEHQVLFVHYMIARLICVIHNDTEILQRVIEHENVITNFKEIDIKWI